MLLLIEIALTIKAWRKGWKGLALIPLGGALFLGMVLGASGASGGQLLGLALAIDGLCIAALACLVAREPAETGSTTAAPAQDASTDGAATA